MRQFHEGFMTNNWLVKQSYNRVRAPAHQHFHDECYYSFIAIVIFDRLYICVNTEREQSFVDRVFVKQKFLSLPLAWVFIQL